MSVLEELRVQLRPPVIDDAYASPSRPFMADPVPPPPPPPPSPGDHEGDGVGGG